MSSKHITNKQGKCFSHRKCREMRKTLPGKVFTVYLFLKIAFTHKIKYFLCPCQGKWIFTLRVTNKNTLEIKNKNDRNGAIEATLSLLSIWKGLLKKLGLVSPA